MTPSLSQHRALHATRAAQLRRFADENRERGLDHFAALDLAAADREQRAAASEAGVRIMEARAA